MKLAIIIISIFTSLQAIACDNGIESILVKIDDFKALSEESLKEATANGKWNKWQSAYGFCYKESISKCYLIIFGAGDPHVTNLSQIEKSNLGKLASPGTRFDNVTTSVSKWIDGDDVFQIELKTVAYLKGERLTVSEPVIVRKNGAILYR